MILRPEVGNNLACETLRSSHILIFLGILSPFPLTLWGILPLIIGLILLLPSYVSYRTVQLTGNGTRFSVAFLCD